MAFSLARSTRRQTYSRDEREDNLGEAMEPSLRRGEMPSAGSVVPTRPRKTARERRNDVAVPHGTRGLRSAQTCVKPWTASRFML